MKICWETWLPKGLVLYDPSFRRSQCPESSAKQGNKVSKGKIRCFSIENFHSGHFLAEKPQQLEICWETWLANGLVLYNQSFWRSQRPEGPAKKENEDFT